MTLVSEEFDVAASSICCTDLCVHASVSLKSPYRTIFSVPALVLSLRRAPTGLSASRAEAEISSRQ